MSKLIDNTSKAQRKNYSQSVTEPHCADLHFSFHLAEGVCIQRLFQVCSGTTFKCPNGLAQHALATNLAFVIGLYSTGCGSNATSLPRSLNPSLGPGE